jgi:hypothetical protein
MLCRSEAAIPNDQLMLERTRHPATDAIMGRQKLADTPNDRLGLEWD